MTIPNKPSYTHGSTGTEPSSSIDYANGDSLDADNLDYYLHTEFTKISEIIDALNTLDSDDDGKVDAADFADSTTTASKVKGNDIDSDGDGKVDSADYADDAGQLDGNDASDFASSGHTHDQRYARLYDGVQHPVYASKSDVPSSISVGETVYIEGDGLYVEDGT